MTIARKQATVAALIAVPAILGLSALVQTSCKAQQAPAQAQIPTNHAQVAVVNDFADQITRLVQNGKVDELSHLTIPANSIETSHLHDWTSEYLTQVLLQEKQRDKQYSDAIAKAQDYLKAEKFDKSMERVVLAYRIAKDPDAFLNLPWVKDLTDKVSARAAKYEKDGQWLDSLQLYSDLNSLYEISTRYKGDYQRLTRRVRLLAVYTPKVLVEMRKKLAEKEADPVETKPATQPADDALEEANFTRWQDTTEAIDVDMARKALQNAQENWVEVTTNNEMIKGGVGTLRLFLTTPELAKEFPGLADPDTRKKFSDALDVIDPAVGAPAGIQGDIETAINAAVAASNATVKLPKEVVIMEFTDGAIEKLDPFTAVIWPHEVPEFEKQMTGNFGGVGIQISLENGLLKVISPLEDTPAYKAGIQAGDLITGINGKSTVGISVDQAVNSIMGNPGTDVILKIKRPDKFEKDYTITRALIKVTSVKGVRRDSKDPTKWDYMLDQENKIGYVRITGFQEDTAAELEAAIKTLKDQGMKGIVLDLRFNPGGLLQAAVKMCDDFLDSGTIVSTKGRSPRALAQSQTWKAAAATEIPNSMPMIVLINEYSASASEIFSGAMKDLHRALIVGHRSFGKGSVQNLLDIGGPNIRRPGSGLPEAMMKLTMAYYYLPNGENLHRRDGNKTWGVDPDVAVDLTPDQLTDLLRNRRDNDIIKATDLPATAPGVVSSTKPATTAPTTAEAPAPDTQLETALLMMRLQLVQTHP